MDTHSERYINNFVWLKRKITKKPIIILFLEATTIFSLLVILYFLCSIISTQSNVNAAREKLNAAQEKRTALNKIARRSSFRQQEGKYDQTRNELIELAKEFRANELSFPFLPSKRCFPLDDPPVFKTFSFLEKRMKEELVDPWGKPYFYDGINGLLHSAGPNGSFRHENDNNGKDDIAVSIKPMLYVKSVVAKRGIGYVIFTFNRRLKNVDLQPESIILIDYYESGHTERVQFDYVTISSWHPDGRVNLDLKRPLKKTGKITCTFKSANQIESHGGLAFSSDEMHFEDLTYSYLKTERSSPLKTYNVNKISREDIDFITSEKLPAGLMKDTPDGWIKDN